MGKSWVWPGQAAREGSGQAGRALEGWGGMGPRSGPRTPATGVSASLGELTSDLEDFQEDVQPGRVETVLRMGRGCGFHSTRPSSVLIVHLLCATMCGAWSHSAAATCLWKQRPGSRPGCVASGGSPSLSELQSAHL